MIVITNIISSQCPYHYTLTASTLLSSSGDRRESQAGGNEGTTRSLNTVKSHFKALGLYNFKRGFGWVYKRGGGGGGLISGWAYKQNKKNVSERRDKAYLRNELKLTFHYILS